MFEDCLRPLKIFAFPFWTAAYESAFMKVRAPVV